MKILRGTQIENTKCRGWVFDLQAPLQIIVVKINITRREKKTLTKLKKTQFFYNWLTPFFRYGSGAYFSIYNEMSKIFNLHRTLVTIWEIAKLYLF